LKAYTPEVASGNTSSAVKVPQVGSIKDSALMGSTPLTSFHGGPSPSGNSHVNSAPAAFHTPTQPNLLKGGVGNFQNKEQRNPVNGIPHLSMAP
jgi:hypothetical protein